MTSYYTYNVFPYGTYEISAAILLQYNNNTVYPDITNLIKIIQNLSSKNSCTDEDIISFNKAIEKL